MTRFAPVPAPAVTRPRVNLLAAANTPTGETLDGQAVRWAEGIAYKPLASGRVALRGVCDPGDPIVIRDACDDIVQAASVYAEAQYECTRLGLQDGTYAEQARATLDAELPRAVERELWTGIGARTENPGTPNRYLTAGSPVVEDITPTPGTAVPPTYALGLLERALRAKYSGVGILHADALAAAFIPKVTRTGNLLETHLGNRLVPGVGYPGTGPGDVAPGVAAAWVYITPMVTVRVGDIVLAGAGDVERVMVDRGVNRLAVTARAPFVVDWDACDAFAVLMQTKHE